LINVLYLKLDQRLAEFAESMGWRYTRYADDLTFSLPKKSKKDPKIGAFFDLVLGWKMLDEIRAVAQ